MAKVLLVDTNFSSAPVYEALLDEGHEVHVVGRDPTDCLAKVAPNYWHLDYSKTDDLAELVGRQGFDYLVPGCTDRSYESCIVVGRGRFPGFDSAETASAISNKLEFRAAAARLDLPVPRVYREQDPPPLGAVIVKPADSFSGKGITVLERVGAESMERAIALASSASPTGACLVEEFVAGQLYSHSAFLADAQVVQDFLVQEDGTANPSVVDTSRVVERAPPGLVDEIRRCATTFAEGLGLVDGLLHTQFISNGCDLWLIESTRRCPGDLYSQLIELSTGYPYAASYVRPFLGGTPHSTSGEGLRPVMRHTITVKAEQDLAHVRFKRRLGIERLVPLALVGDHLLPSPLSRVAVIFCSAGSQTELEELYRATLARELYEVPDRAGAPAQGARRWIKGRNT